MFPELNLDNVVEEDERNQIKKEQGFTYLYDFKKGDFVIKNGRLIEIKGKEGVKVWIEKVLLTEEFVYKIYGENREEEYGTTIRKMLLGRKIPQLLLHSELKRIISEKLKQNVEIERIENFEFKQEYVTFTISFKVILKNAESFVQEVKF